MALGWKLLITIFLIIFNIDFCMRNESLCLVITMVLRKTSNTTLSTELSYPAMRELDRITFLFFFKSSAKFRAKFGIWLLEEKGESRSSAKTIRARSRLLLGQRDRISLPDISLIQQNRARYFSLIRSEIIMCGRRASRNR